MEKEGFKRKLNTIFSADVAGYNRLMDVDEAATVKTLRITNLQSDVRELFTVRRSII